MQRILDFFNYEVYSYDHPVYVKSIGGFIGVLILAYVVSRLVRALILKIAADRLKLHQKKSRLVAHGIGWLLFLLGLLLSLEFLGLSSGRLQVVLNYRLYTLSQDVTLKSFLWFVLVVFATPSIAQAIRIIAEKLFSRYLAGHEQLTNTVVRLLGLLVVIGGLFLALGLMGVSPGAIDKFLNSPVYTIKKQPVNLLSLVIGGLMLLVTYYCYRGVPKVLNQNLYHRFELNQAMKFTVTRVSQYVIGVIGVLIAVTFVGIELGGLAVIAGLMSVGLGFGLQNIVSNFVSGIILLFERPIQIGDRIQVGDIIGDVMDVKIRSTVVKTMDNVSILVPNSEFVSSTVTNWSHRDPKIRLHIPVGVAYGSDVEKVKECLLAVAANHPKVLEMPNPEVQFLEFGDSSLNFDLLAWIADPADHMVIKSDLHFGVDKSFREHDITIPFPQRDVHLYNT